MSMVFDRQRVVALERANTVRMERVRQRERIRRMGRVESCAAVADALEGNVFWARSMMVFKLLRWARSSDIRAVDGGVVRSWLLRAQVRSEVRPVGDLSARQRGVLAGLVREWGAR